MERVVSKFPFLKKSRHWSGAVEVLEVIDDSEQKHIYLRMRVGRHTVRLPRTGLQELIDALHKAGQDASKRYEALVRRMNRGK